MMAMRRRTLLHVLLFWLFYFAILYAAGTITASSPPAVKEMRWGALSSVGVLLSSLVAIAWLRLRPADAGLVLTRRSVLEFGVGVVAGFALYALHLLILVSTGAVRIVPAASFRADLAVVPVCTYLALSCMEELGFRGYALLSLERAFGSWPALSIAALVFGLSHVLFGWPLLAVVAGVIPGALLFGMAALTTRNVMLPIALHAAWNVADWAAGAKSARGGGPSPWELALNDANPAAAAIATASFVGLFLLATLAFRLIARRRAV
jgi:membrane protease YdiL (CAAX protease family)